MKNKVNIGILLGDPSGIGPELISKLLQASCICLDLSIPNQTLVG